MATTLWPGYSLLIYRINYYITFSTIKPWYSIIIVCETIVDICLYPSNTHLHIIANNSRYIYCQTEHFVVQLVVLSLIATYLTMNVHTYICKFKQ